VVWGRWNLQLSTAHISQFRNMNSREVDFSVSQNCKTFAQVMTNLNLGITGFLFRGFVLK
jgi:hypothetical protein